MLPAATAAVAVAAAPCAAADEVPAAPALPPVVTQVNTAFSEATDAINHAIDDAFAAAEPAWVEATGTAFDFDKPHLVAPEISLVDSGSAQTASPYSPQPLVVGSFAISPVEIEGVRPNGPNYRWTDDILSQILAGRPGPVLKRIEESHFSGPDIPPESIAAEIDGKSLFGPGTPVYLGPGMLCTLAVAGHDTHGNMVGITAGHCGRQGQLVMSADSWPVGPTGVVEYVSEDYDYSLIRFVEPAQITRSYNGVTVNSIGGVTNPNATLCKLGVATGLTCGPQWSNDELMNISQVCAMQGDSGAPLMQGDRMVGMVAGGIFPDSRLACRSPLQGPLFMPTASRSMQSILDDLDAGGGLGAGLRLPDA